MVAARKKTTQTALETTIEDRDEGTTFVHKTSHTRLHATEINPVFETFAVHTSKDTEVPRCSCTPEFEELYTSRKHCLHCNSSGTALLEDILVPHIEDLHCCLHGHIFEVHKERQARQQTSLGVVRVFEIKQPLRTKETALLCFRACFASACSRLRVVPIPWIKKLLQKEEAIST